MIVSKLVSESDSQLVSLSACKLVIWLVFSCVYPSLAHSFRSVGSQRRAAVGVLAVLWSPGESCCTAPRIWREAACFQAILTISETF